MTILHFFWLLPDFTSVSFLDDCTDNDYELLMTAFQMWLHSGYPKKCWSVEIQWMWDIIPVTFLSVNQLHFLYNALNENMKFIFNNVTFYGNQMGLRAGFQVISHILFSEWKSMGDSVGTWDSHLSSWLYEKFSFVSCDSGWINHSVTFVLWD